MAALDRTGLGLSPADTMKAILGTLESGHTEPPGPTS